MTRALLMAILATTTGIADASAQSQANWVESPIATVSWPLVAQTSATGQRMFQRLIERDRDWTAKLDPERRALASQQQGLAGLPEGDGKVRAFRRAQVSFERRQEDARTELVDLQRQIEAEFRAMVGPVLEALVKERRVLVVLEREAPMVLWATTAVDLSDALAERLDRLK